MNYTRKENVILKEFAYGKGKKSVAEIRHECSGVCVSSQTVKETLTKSPYAVLVEDSGCPSDKVFKLRDEYFLEKI